MSNSLIERPRLSKDQLDQLREVLDPYQAKKMGHSGWIGFDMFREYNELVSGRNSRIVSRTLSNNTTLQSG